MKPLVSIITPTFQREGHLAHALRWVTEQTYPNIEWLILDDSPQPSQVLNGSPDPRVSYEHIDRRLTIGDKRNRLIAKARGSIIAHFDDDDYYAPRFLEFMVSALATNGAEFANLCSWYLYDFRHKFFGFCDLTQISGLHYLCFQDAVRLFNFTGENNQNLRDNFLGYGFTYVYFKKVWESSPFPSRDWGEDTVFVKAAKEKFQLLSISDKTGLVLHALHANSSSSCFPQYHLPNFLLPTLFGPYRESWGQPAVRSET